MNMSYCRFHNTDLALQDCLGELEEMQAGAGGKLSDAELRAAKGLAIDCMRFVELLLDTDIEANGEEVKESLLEDRVDYAQASADYKEEEEDEDDE